MFANRDVVGSTPAKRVALDVLEAGVRAADPERVVAATIRVEGSTLTVQGTEYDLGAYERVVVLGGGNAAGVVANALETRVGEYLDGGVVVTDNPVGTTIVEEVVGDHPVPSRDAVVGAERVLETAEDATADTLVLAVVTGGGSALLPAPVSGVGLEDVQALTTDLLASGVDIHALNTVRKHLSRIKGGCLAAAAAPATVVGLVFSDVVGNDPSVVASGPLSPDATTYSDAVTVLDDADITPPTAVTNHLETGVRGDHPETPSPTDDLFQTVDVYVLADGHTALDAARTEAQHRGLETLLLSGSIEGEARTVGAVHAAIARETLHHGNPLEPPAVILSGGETTVTLEAGGGRGGPNQECALGAGTDITRWATNDDAVVVACMDTDGIDGNTEAAGAILDQSTITDLDTAQHALDSHDVTPYLERVDAVLETGFTGTNVNDLRVLVVGRPPDDDR